MYCLAIVVFCVCFFAGKSDPYVKIKLGGEQEVKTEVIDGTLNPRWNQKFDLLVYERSVEVIHSKMSSTASAT